MKRLWRHIADCKDEQCQVPHCKSSRYVLSHYHRCKDLRCEVCGPVREAIQRNHEKAKKLAIEKAKQLGVPCDVPATTPPVPPLPSPASKPVDDQRARRISIAAAVAEAAASGGESLSSESLLGGGEIGGLDEVLPLHLVDPNDAEYVGLLHELLRLIPAVVRYYLDAVVLPDTTAHSTCSATSTLR